MLFVCYVFVLCSLFCVFFVCLCFRVFSPLFVFFSMICLFALCSFWCSLFCAFYICICVFVFVVFPLPLCVLFALFKDVCLCLFPCYLFCFVFVLSVCYYVQHRFCVIVSNVFVYRFVCLWFVCCIIVRAWFRWFVRFVFACLCLCLCLPPVFYYCVFVCSVKL